MVIFYSHFSLPECTWMLGAEGVCTRQALKRHFWISALPRQKVGSTASVDAKALADDDTRWGNRCSRDLGVWSSIFSPVNNTVSAGDGSKLSQMILWHTQPRHEVYKCLQFANLKPYKPWPSRYVVSFPVENGGSFQFAMWLLTRGQLTHWPTDHVEPWWGVVAPWCRPHLPLQLLSHWLWPLPSANPARRAMNRYPTWRCSAPGQGWGLLNLPNRFARLATRHKLKTLNLLNLSFQGCF